LLCAEYGEPGIGGRALFRERGPSAAGPAAPAIFASPTTNVPLPEVVTTDFFAFDDTSNTFGLQGLGAAVEMGDAVLGMVIEQLGPSAPRWIAVRNASDPEIDSAGLTEKQAAAKAAQIYRAIWLLDHDPERHRVLGAHSRQLTACS
jgi:hypothetical protein